MFDLYLFISGSEIFIILLVVLLLFGANKIPEIARGLGKGFHEFKKATQDIKDEFNEQTSDIKKEVNNIKEDLSMDYDKKSNKKENPFSDDQFKKTNNSGQNEENNQDNSQNNNQDNSQKS